MQFKKLNIGGKHGGDKIKGSGSDDVGKFKIKGHFDKHSSEVKFEKEYIGKHTVVYHGKW